MFWTQIIQQVLLLSIFWTACLCMPLNETSSEARTVNEDSISDSGSEEIPSRGALFTDYTDDIYSDESLENGKTCHETHGGSTTRLQNSKFDPENILNNDIPSVLSDNVNIQILELNNAINQRIKDMNNLRNENDKLKVKIKENYDAIMKHKSENIQLKLNLKKCQARTVNVDSISDYWSEEIPSNYVMHIDYTDDIYVSDESMENVEIRHEMHGEFTTTLQNSKFDPENILNNDIPSGLSENVNIQILELNNVINQQINEMNNLRNENDKLKVKIKEHYDAIMKHKSENIQLKLNLKKCQMNGKTAVIIYGLEEQMKEDCESGNWNKSVKIMKRHLNHNTEAYKQVNSITEYDEYPFKVVQSGYVELLEVMLDNGLLINRLKENVTDLSMLQWAVMYGDYDVAQSLLLRGADWNVKDWLGWTPIHWAIVIRKLNIVQLLVETGVDINVTDKYGDTALHLAARKGLKSIVQWLVENGCNTTIRNENGETARDMAATQEIKEIITDKYQTLS